MVLAKSKNSVGLGNSLMNDRFGKGKASAAKKGSHNSSVTRKDQNGEMYITNGQQEASWVKMRSITEQAALDEFLSTAELAGTDFTAEKINNVKIIHADQKNPYLLSAAEERSTVKKHQKNKARLTVPRRPKWDSTTTAQQLDVMERESLLQWRRGLAELQETNDLLMTPFERNLEVWRQLWRVIERSDLVVQIVDARNPLLYRCADLDTYVQEIDPKKRNLLLVNKADLLTDKQRESWADYFERNNIDFRFFSAHLAKEKNEARLLEEEQSGSESESESEEELVEATKDMDIQESKGKQPSTEEDQNEQDGGVTLSDSKKFGRTDILDVEELEELFLANSPENLPQSGDSEEQPKKKTTIGLVGYPNVGKSSTINALLGAKKVSVSSTPGKTKHFQTLYLSPEIMLCDCPGLVFPNFATTKAELVCNGVLPIDQQREFVGPAGLVAQRVPRQFIEDVYGVKINVRPPEEGGTGIPTAHEVLRAYARARGFATTGQGQPDESRAARYILKDYVNGKLLFCHPPPVPEGQDPIDPLEYNKDLYDVAHLPARRREMLAKAAQEHPEDEELDEELAPLPPTKQRPAEMGARSRNLDTGFFGPGSGGSTGRMTMPFNSQYTEQGKQMRKNLSGRKERMMVAIERGIDVSEVRPNTKKHFKANKRAAKKERKGPEKDADDF